MRVGIVTLFPGMFDLVTRFGVLGRACEAELLELCLADPRDYTIDRHRTVDDRSYGGGPGMVLKPEPIAGALSELRKSLCAAPVIYLTPQGERFDHRYAQDLSELGEFILLTGRYEGVDQRILDHHVDRELSIGDYVLSGGELAAMVVIDAVARLLPGVLGDAASAQADSFVEPLLDHPHFTRPAQFQGSAVPDVLLRGDHQAVSRWRRKQALGRTRDRRPDLLAACELTDLDRELLNEYQREAEGPGS